LECLNKLRKLNLFGNNISEVKGLENLINLIELRIGNNPIPHEVLENCGGINSNGYANNPKLFVRFCIKN
jgi:hypothetical protein